MSEWGNPAGVNTCDFRMEEGTQGTETSQYLEEQKETSIPLVAASEHGGAQTKALALWGCRTSF